MRDVQVTRREAANQVGLTVAAIDQWIHRGHLAYIPETGRPRKLWLSHVFECEATRAHNMRRTRHRGTFASAET